MSRRVFPVGFPTVDGLLYPPVSRASVIINGVGVIACSAPLAPMAAIVELAPTLFVHRVQATITLHQHRALRFLFARALRALLSFTTRRFDREALDIYSCPAHVRVHDALLPRPSASASLGVNYSEFLSYLLLLALINSLNCTQPTPPDRVCAAHDSQQGGSVVHTSAVKCYCLRQHFNTLGVQ